MTYPVLPEYEGIPPAYQQATWVPDPAYEGGGYFAGYSVGRHYSLAELEKLWLDAGGPASAAGPMATIAEYTESGGDAGDWNSSGATGLWQIEWPSNYPGPRQDLFTPLTNARTAVKMFRARGYQPWGSDPHWDPGVAPARTVPGERQAVTGGSPATGAVTTSFSWNPLDWPSQISQGIGGTLTDLAVLVPLILGAAAIGVFGVIRATQGPRQRLEQRAEERATQAAQIAMVAA